MNEENRNKNVNQADLDLIFSRLSKLEGKFINESKRFLSIGADGEKGGNVYSMDLFVSGIANRAISLIAGFLLLARDDNYISAVPLIRIQLDNCLRFYASTLVKNYNDFFIKYLSGEHIGNLSDSEGNRMTDSYLAKKLDNTVKPGILKLYKNSSGYVHLSNEHSFLQSELVGERTISTKIGKYDFFKIDQKVDFAYNMYVVSDLLVQLVASWTFQKQKVESERNKTKGLKGK